MFPGQQNLLIRHCHQRGGDIVSLRLVETQIDRQARLHRERGDSLHAAFAGVVRRGVACKQMSDIVRRAGKVRRDAVGTLEPLRVEVIVGLVIRFLSVTDPKE